MYLCTADFSDIRMRIDVNERVRLAQDFFMEGYNCTQAVVLAFEDILGSDRAVLERLSIGLGGGVGRLREVCGTVNAMAVIAGTLASLDGKTHQQQKKDTYSIVQELAGMFREENGSIICRELMGLRAEEKQNPVPQERTPEYYKSRPCLRLVACSARIIAEYVKKNSQLAENLEIVSNT